MNKDLATNMFFEAFSLRSHFTNHFKLHFKNVFIIHFEVSFESQNKEILELFFKKI
jgi:hypothetical protein